MPPLALEPADGLEITILVDNQVDMLLPSTEEVVRRPFAPAMYNPILEDDVRATLHAEHGFAALVTLVHGDERRTLLFDSGISPNGLIENMDRLQLDARDIEAIVLSHGHFDHTGGLAGLVERLGRAEMPMILHPDAFAVRRLAPPGREPSPLPPPSRSAIEGAGFEIVASDAPTLIFDDRILVTGEVPRVTAFEQGFPYFERQAEDGGWAPEPHLPDDQCIAVNVRDRGLVVLTGCGHAGIINTVRRAQEVTGAAAVHGILGGFHLSGPVFDPIIAPTVGALRAFAPALVVPGHCTGWRAQAEIARQMPDAFVANAVGTTFRF